MKISHLRFKFRIKATAYRKGKVEKAKSYIKQEGKLRRGLWGEANSKLSKIYILKLKKKIIYVGITKQSLSRRFIQGLTATGKKGYHGYRWKELAIKGESDLIDLFVYTFKSKERIEAIEAEIAYLIRNRTGKWPEYQTEIHFHQANLEEIKMAQEIYRQVNSVK